MANNLPSGLYSTGAVVFDSQPYANFYSGMMARKQAKDEALDQQYQNQFKNVNPAGMRTQDIPLFTEKVNEWQKFYQENKDRIRNPRLDGGKAASEFQARQQDALALTQQSKNEQKKYEELVPILRDPDKRSRLPESVITDLASHELPLGDPSRKSFDISKLSFDAKPFDVTMQKNYLQGIQQGLKMDEATTGVKTDPQTLMQTVTTTSSFGNEAKQAIHSRAAGAYGSDPSFKHFVDSELAKPQNYAHYNEIFKKAYGTDIAHPEDLAAAYTLGSIQDNIVKEKTQADAFARQKYMEGLRFADAKALAKYKDDLKGLSRKEQDDWLTSFIGDTFDVAQKGPTLKYQASGGGVMDTKELKISPSLKEALGGRDTYRLTPEGDIIYFDFDRYSEGEKDSKGKVRMKGEIKEGPNGNRAVDKSKVGRMSKQEFKALIGKKLIGIKALNQSLDAEDFDNEPDADGDDINIDNLRQKYKF